MEERVCFGGVASSRVRGLPLVDRCLRVRPLRLALKFCSSIGLFSTLIASCGRTRVGGCVPTIPAFDWHGAVCVLVYPAIDNDVLFPVAFVLFVTLLAATWTFDWTVPSLSMCDDCLKEVLSDDVERAWL